MDNRVHCQLLSILAQILRRRAVADNKVNVEMVRLGRLQVRYGQTCHRVTVKRMGKKKRGHNLPSLGFFVFSQKIMRGGFGSRGGSRGGFGGAPRGGAGGFRGGRGIAWLMATLI